MPEQPLVSIIIPTYNRAHLIGETLDSVLAQTYQNWECIVVDDGSTDDTDALMAEYLAKDSRFRYYHRPKDRLPGGNAARNYGFEQSRGEYIQWFDSDDLMMPEKLDKAIGAFLKNKVDLVVSNFRILGSKKDVQILKFQDILKFHITTGTLNTPMCLFSKEKVEGFTFDETLLKDQEYEFFTRFFYNNEIKFLIIEEPLCAIRDQESSITGNYLKGKKKYILSSLKSKLYAYKCSLKYDISIQEIALGKFKNALWKSFVFKHNDLYFEYLNLYYKYDKTFGFLKKQKSILMAIFYFNFNRGAQFFKKRFFR